MKPNKGIRAVLKSSTRTSCSGVSDWCGMNTKVESPCCAATLGGRLPPRDARRHLSPASVVFSMPNLHAKLRIQLHRSHRNHQSHRNREPRRPPSKPACNAGRKNHSLVDNHLGCQRPFTRRPERRTAAPGRRCLRCRSESSTTENQIPRSEYQHHAVLCFLVGVLFSCVSVSFSLLL